MYRYTKSFALFRESFALIRESYALIREKYIFCLYENEPNRLSYISYKYWTSCFLSSQVNDVLREPNALSVVKSVEF